MKITEIINLPALKEYIKKSYGPKCSVNVWGCSVCRVYILFDEIKKFVETMEEFEKDEERTK